MLFTATSKERKIYSLKFLQSTTHLLDAVSPRMAIIVVIILIRGSLDVGEAAKLSSLLPALT